LSYTLGNCYWY